MLLLLLSLCGGPPDLARLGADSWDVREREDARCNNALLTLLLPSTHPDAEVDYRVKRLKSRNLRWLSRLYVERAVYNGDFGLWVKLYLAEGRSLIARDADVFADIHRDGVKAYAVFAVLSPVDGYTSFLTGTICPGEYERYLEFLDHHERLRRTAPAPHEKR